METAIRKIAFFRMSALGDCVLATAAINALIKAYPQCEITWITTAAIAKMLKGMPGVTFLVIEKPNSLSDYWRLRAQLKPFQFDILIAAQASLRANAIYPLINATRKIGFDNKRAKDLHRCFVSEQIEYSDQHLAEGFMSFAKYLGIQDCSYRWYIHLEAVMALKASSLRNKPLLIGINIAASKKERSWPAESIVALIKKIKSCYDCQIVLLGGTSAFERQQEQTVMAEVAEHDVITMVGRTSLSYLVSLIDELDCLISPDSGPVHIATAVNTPVVGLYAVARPELSGPYQSPNYTVNKYPQAVEVYLKKPVEKANWHERVHTREAMNLVSVEDVMEQLKNWGQSKFVK